MTRERLAGDLDVADRTHLLVHMRGDAVIALAAEDDVRILRWKEKYDAIPEDSKDPNLIKAKKSLKRKRPARSDNRTYWSEGQFKQLQAAKPGKLYKPRRNPLCNDSNYKATVSLPGWSP